MKEVLNLTFYKGSDLYCDGDIEDELLDICTNKNINEVLMNENRWPILYHLSDIRHNLLEWYDFEPNANLLEIGAGCGALSGIFCKKVKKVVGIELSKKRSQINAMRNRNCDNLEIYVGNFEDIELDEKFDYISLIGVLEYASSYINHKEPFLAMILRIKKLLKPNGKLIIAIENKYGLKYWAGATEDHTGNMYDGIQDYNGVDNVRTFSKNEIEKLLRGAGYSDFEFYYPIPDYKLPTVVYSERCLPKPGEMRNLSYAYDRDRLVLFDEGAVYDGLCQENNFEYFSNSFLIFADSK